MTESMIWRDKGSYQSLETSHGEVILEPRPHYCDRGRFLAKVFPKHGPECRPCNVDHHDLWPRFYFDEARAKAEIWAWLTCRGWLV